jgi:hypothetical protein
MESGSQAVLPAETSAISRRDRQYAAPLDLSSGLMRIRGRALLLRAVGPAAAAAAIWATLLVACTRTTAAPPPATLPPPTELHALRAADLTDAERKYGRAPQRDASVTYGRDVIIVDGGPNIVRSLSPDGLVCTIDPGVPQAKALEVGKIAFVSGRCVGRVLAVTRDQDGLHLVLGPAEITDLFERVNVTFDDPVDVTQMLEYAPPTFENVTYPLSGDQASLPEWSAELPTQAKAAWSSGAGDGVGYRPASAQPVSPGIPQRLNLKFYTTDPKKENGPYAEIRKKDNGAVVIAQVQLRAPKPHLHFHLKVINGEVDAAVVLQNSAGIRIAFDAAASDQFYRNLTLYAPGPDLSVPVGGPAPFTLTMKQGIWVKTEFSSRSTSFSAGGDYDFNADIGITYSGGKFGWVGPKGLQERQNLINNMGGVSISPRGIVVSHQLSIIGGIGAFGFATGPEFDLGTSFGVAQGSNVAIVNCRGANVAMHLRGGMGWAIPKPMQAIVNFFLRLFRTAEIPDHGGVHSEWHRLFNVHTQSASKVCGGGQG